jgi:hypothetical protein
LEAALGEIVEQRIVTLMLDDAKGAASTDSRREPKARGSGKLDEVAAADGRN